MENSAPRHVAYRWLRCPTLGVFSNRDVKLDFSVLARKPLGNPSTMSWAIFGKIDVNFGCNSNWDLECMSLGAVV